MNRVKTKIEETLNKALVSLCLSGKLSVAILLLSVCSVTSFAQVSFGVKSGMNINSILLNYDNIPSNSNGLYSNNSSMGYGFYFGGNTKVPIGDKTSILQEIQFTVRGDKTLNLNYIEAPVLFSYSINKLIDLHIGFNAAWRILSSDYEYVKKFNSFDYGLTGGASLNISKHFFFNLRYYYGLTSIKTVDYRTQTIVAINPDDPLISSNAPIVNFYNRSFQFGIGYKIK